ncbi:DUF2569 domain-containing protein [Pleionea mediterranea]|uniref:Uncharacterized protein DUF2569 n=1 Tax=Pleionea mediterranea TaxID=523701 RepID=A0A316FBW0_9GAMM|nr:DUF2569 domain-containing protein [Pleionea mediterranea]PWK46344.1 uncharacterized protein DUF2569 [Pleionea mediterranea]
MNDWPKYDAYHLHELKESLNNINENERPDEAKYVRELIEKGGYQFPDKNSNIEESEANKIKPEGIGGWLVLPVFGLLITPIVFGFEFINVILPTFDEKIWTALTTQGSSAYHPVWAPYLIFLSVARAFMALSAIALLVFLFKKRVIFPKLMIAFYTFTVAIAVSDIAVLYVFILDAFPHVATGIENEATQQFINALVIMLIWIPYFMKSERVKNTFIH